MGRSTHQRLVRAARSGSVRQLQDAEEEARRAEEARAKVFVGKPTKLIKERYWAKFYQVVLCDPTAAGFTVVLPRPTNNKIGAVVGVKNHSGSTNTITIACSTGNETIDGAATDTITTAREMVVYQYVGDDDWIVAGKN